MVQEVKKQRKFLSIWAISLIGTLIIISSLYIVNISIGIQNFSKIVSLPAYTIIPGLLIVLSIWAIAKADSIKEIPKKSLIFLSLAFSFWFIAEQTWNLYEHVLGIDPYPSIADFFYILAPIFMFISLKIFLNSSGKEISKTILFVASSISLIILVPSIMATFEVGAEDEPFEIIVALAYPVADAILLVPAIITISLISHKPNFFWVMILTGIIVMLAADTIFLFLVIADEYIDGHPVDILFVSSYTIWAFMLFYTIIDSKNNPRKKETIETYKKYGTKKLEQYGIVIGLILINVTVAILLVTIYYFMEPNPDNTILGFFSWILVMMVVIFSSVIILLNSKLNKVLQNRTLQLEEKTSDLIKSERFSAIGELASRIAHDIRNPLSNINMSIELMKIIPSDTKMNDKEVGEKLELISKNVQRISHQINDVLGFVQNRKLKIEQISLLKCLHESIESINLPGNITLKLPKSETTVLADRFQLQIVFNNIIINAIQSIGKKEGEISFRFYENDKVKIEIENSGPSIPEELLPRIFDSLVTTRQVGTGLGLASCKTIIENHKGTITVQNNPTTFTITFPMRKD